MTHKAAPPRGREIPQGKAVTGIKVSCQRPGCGWSWVASNGHGFNFVCPGCGRSFFVIEAVIGEPEPESIAVVEGEGGE